MANKKTRRGATKRRQPKDSASPKLSDAEKMESFLTQKSAVVNELALLRASTARLEQQKHDLEQAAESVVLLAAQAQCRDFAELFLSKFPRELRDMVYEHVWDEKEKKRHQSKGLERPPRCSKADGDLCRCYERQDISLWVQDQFVGMEVANEAALAYYKGGLPVIHHNLIPNLEDMLLKDHFHLGMQFTDHLRRVDLDLCAFDAAQGSYRYIDRSISTGGHLKALLQVRVMKGFRLHIKRVWRSGDPTDLSFKGLIQVARALKRAGATVSAQAWQPFFNKYFNVSDYFDLPTYEWNSKWRAKIDAGVPRRIPKLLSSLDEQEPLAIKVRSVLKKYKAGKLFNIRYLMRMAETRGQFPDTYTVFDGSGRLIPEVDEVLKAPILSFLNALDVSALPVLLPPLPPLPGLSHLATLPDVEVFELSDDSSDLDDTE